MKPVTDYLEKWNKQNDSIGKLQGAYAALAVIALIVAGIVGLVNDNLGQSILFLAFVLAMAFVGNGVVWALLQTFVVARLVKPAAKPRKK